jgi:hypothetical protein
MSNDVTKTHEPEPDQDDGFSGSLASGRLIKGTLARWTDSTHWVDRDGLALPSPLLVVAINEVLQMWKGGKATVIPDKPLPVPDELNAAIPVREWEIGPDEKPRPPWQHVIVVYFVDLATGAFYTYAAPTVGAHIAYDALKESVITMRALRGTKCMPLVNLSERPMKTKFGMKVRPHFEIVGWKTPGEDGKAVQAKPTPQLTGPAAEPASTPTPTPTPTRTPTPTPTPTPASPSAPVQKRKPKPPVNLAAETVAALSDVKPVSLSEELDDEVGF